MLVTLDLGELLQKLGMSIIQVLMLHTVVTLVHSVVMGDQGMS